MGINCKQCNKVSNMPAKDSTANFLTPEQTTALEEALGLETGKFKIRKLVKYDSRTREHTMHLVVKEKGVKEPKVLSLGVI